MRSSGTGRSKTIWRQGVSIRFFRKSERVGEHYRALATEKPQGIVWFWIGTHAEYDQLLA